MHRQMGSIFLVAGTCIGSGMIALPMVLAKLGLVPSIILMILIWFVSYYTSLIHLELNLKAGRGQDLRTLGRIFSGPIAGWIGMSSIKLLSYALLGVYIYAGSSVLQKLLFSDCAVDFQFDLVASVCAATMVSLLMLPIKVIDYLNRILFLALLGIVFILMTGLSLLISWNDLPLFAADYQNISAWSMVIPVIFGAFGFQVIFHTLTNYCNKNVKMLKRAFLWGSLIAFSVYIVWTFAVLSVVYHQNPAFYQQMVLGKVEVGDLIHQLSALSQWKAVQTLVWWISFLAIITSILGVGLGLCDSIKSMMFVGIQRSILRNFLAALVSILPAYLIAVLVPNAFITVLGFAGMILVIIAILLPVYLFYKAKCPSVHYPELKAKSMIYIMVIAGLLIMSCEIANLFMG